VTASDKTLICLLVINKVKEMPKLALDSILRSTSDQILVGYLKESDLSELPSDPRITFVDLSNKVSGEILLGASEYVDFSQEQFYQLVQYKWVLLKYAQSLDFDTIIFSDFDVYWNRSPVDALNSVFLNDPETRLQIQTYTSDPSNEQLCMGFVAFRTGSELSNLVSKLAEIHRNSLMQNPFTGDDDVISDYYRNNAVFRQQVRLLPQSTFPTGNLINLYSKKNFFPGLVPYNPYIFHANFVVGSSKKVKLLKAFIYGGQYGQVSSTGTLRIMMSLAVLRYGVFVKRLFKQKS
jgi:hypothetical protein